MIGENDNWSSTPEMQQVMRDLGALPFTSGSKDAAILLRNQPAGSYTVHSSYIIDPQSGGNVVSFEAYQLNAANAATGLFANVSTRGRVSNGDRVMIPGFVLIGDFGTTTLVLVRAVGPTLGQSFGVADALPDPRIGLYRGSDTVGTNDNWSVDPVNRQACIDAAVATGAFPLIDGSLDAALVLDLQPGAYTALCFGGSNAPEGNALVEVYVVPPAPWSTPI